MIVVVAPNLCLLLHDGFNDDLVSFSSTRIHTLLVTRANSVSLTTTHVGDEGYVKILDLFSGLPVKILVQLCYLQLTQK